MSMKQVSISNSPLSRLRENFPLQTATLRKTGPVFVTEAILQYPFSKQLFVMDWDYVGGHGSSQQAIVMDPPGCHWDDKQVSDKIPHFNPNLNDFYDNLFW